MVKQLIGSFAALTLFLSSGAVEANSPNTGAIPVSVAAMTSGSYTGAPTQAALIVDFETAANSAGAESGMTCFPLDDTIGTSTQFLDQCSGGGVGDNINFPDSTGQPNSAGFESSDPTPSLITPLESAGGSSSLSVSFNSQTTRMPSNYSLLPSSASWTVFAAMNHGGPFSSSQDILNTGNPSSGIGAELFVNSSSEFELTAGKGSGSGDTVLTSSATDTAGNASRIAVVSWNAGSKTFSIYAYNESTQTLTGPQTATTTNFSGGSTPIGIVVPTSGSGTTPFVGNMSWIADIPAALSQTAITNLITDMAGTQPPVVSATPNPNAPVTQLASALSHDAGFDTEFNFGSTAQDNYENQGPDNVSTRALHFMNVTQLRDSDNSADATPYTQFCSTPLGNRGGGFRFSQGDSLQDGSGPYTQSDISKRWDNVKTATGCYPGFNEPANEADDTTNATLLANDSACTGNVKAPLWATLLVRDLHNAYAARASNSAYANIKLYGPGLANPHYDELSAAQECYYGKTLFPVDFSIQHTGLVAINAAPEGSSGITSAQVSHIYATDPDDFSGYAQPGHTGYIPQLWDEWGEGYFSPYEPSGNNLTQALAAHYMPRAILKIFSLGFTYTNDLDFLTDHVCDTAAGYSGNTAHNGCAFSQNGILDTRGNLKPPGYTLANMLYYIGYGNTGTRSTATQLNYTTTGGNSTLAKYTVQNDDGSYWIILVDGAEEGIKTPNAGSSNVPTSKGGSCSGTIIDANHLTGTCFNLFFQGAYLGHPSGFSTVSINGLPSNITHAVVYQNDEYCNTRQTAVSTTLGTPYQSLASGATSNRDCFQWWPAGSLQNSVQPSFPTVSGGSITGIKYDGFPLLIHVDGSQLNPIPTATPMPDESLATPSGSGPTQAPAADFEPPTPVPQFAPPTGTIPTPPA